MSLCDHLAAFFAARPHQWIDARQLLPIAGFAGWRTRCSDLRKPPFNMDIQNRWRTVNGYRVSEYRFVPKDLFQLTAPNADQIEASR